jgi:hypothetical protein
MDDFVFKYAQKLNVSNQQLLELLRLDPEPKYNALVAMRKLTPKENTYENFNLNLP